MPFDEILIGTNCLPEEGLAIPPLEEPFQALQSLWQKLVRGVQKLLLRFGHRIGHGIGGQGFLDRLRELASSGAYPVVQGAAHLGGWRLRLWGIQGARRRSGPRGLVFLQDEPRVQGTGLLAGRRREGFRWLEGIGFVERRRVVGGLREAELTEMRVDAGDRLNGVRSVLGIVGDSLVVPAGLAQAFPVSQRRAASM